MWYQSYKADPGTSMGPGVDDHERRGLLMWETAILVFTLNPGDLAPLFLRIIKNTYDFFVQMLAVSGILNSAHPPSEITYF